MKTQNDLILSYLKSSHVLTPLQALDRMTRESRSADRLSQTTKE